jgi:tRNA threonylcarbamoyladenosine biosynthesis protein TsaE
MPCPELLATVTTESATATEALGRKLGEQLRGGRVLALVGELGAGKTTFVRGLAHGLGVDHPEEVRSPTWLLMVEHEGPVPLLHMDAYFAGRGADFLADGGAAYSAEEGVLVVEWADRLAQSLPVDSLVVEIAHRGEDRRELRFAGLADAWRAVVERTTS